MFKRTIGVLLVLVAGVSLVISLLTAASVWRWRAPAAEAILSTLRLADATLATTNDALVAIDEVLVNAGSSVAAAEDSFISLSQTISATGPLLDGLAGFLGQGLPGTLRSTQSTVAAAAESARIVDIVLETLSAIPFLNFNIAPQTPLSKTLGDVAITLDALPAGLEALGVDLAATGDTLPGLARSLGEFGASISEADESLSRAQAIIASYQDLIVRYQGLIRSLERLVPVLTSIVPALLTFVILWLAVVQIAAIVIGWRWARGDQAGNRATATFPQPAS